MLGGAKWGTSVRNCRTLARWASDSATTWDTWDSALLGPRQLRAIYSQSLAFPLGLHGPDKVLHSLSLGLL